MNDPDFNSVLDDVAQRTRHASFDFRTGPPERNKQWTEMVHGDVLDAIEKELMLGKIFKAGFQHRINDEHPGKE